MKSLRMLIIILLFTTNLVLCYADQGFYIGYKGGGLVKADIAGAFTPKNIVDPQKKYDSSIFTGIGEYGMTNPHNFPRVLEAQAAVFAEMIFFWGYKFPRIFSLGSSIILSNFVMPSLSFDFKFSFNEQKMIRPYIFLDIYGGILDGFPIGVAAGGGIDIYIDKNLFFLVESKVGAEIFVRRYYDDGNNANAIWHFESTYAYGIFAIYLGVGYRFNLKIRQPLKLSKI